MTTAAHKQCFDHVFFNWMHSSNNHVFYWHQFVSEIWRRVHDSTPYSTTHTAHKTRKLPKSTHLILKKKINNSTQDTTQEIILHTKPLSITNAVIAHATHHKTHYERNKSTHNTRQEIIPHTPNTTTPQPTHH